MLVGHVIEWKLSIYGDKVTKQNKWNGCLWICTFVGNANSLVIDFDGLSTPRLIHHFPETHQLLPCHTDFLKVTHYMTWMNEFSCQNDLKIQASETLYKSHVDWFMGLYSGGKQTTFPITSLRKVICAGEIFYIDMYQQN